jgi:hypothetical protein
VTVADDYQVSLLTVEIERCVVITWQRTVLQVVSQVCVSSCWKLSIEANVAFGSAAVANMISIVATDFADTTYHAIWIYLVGHSQCHQ